jgi:ABC-2 type transport system permease protein
MGKSTRGDIGRSAPARGVASLLPTARALRAVIRKELRQTFRDRRMAAMLILAPVIQLTLLGYAVDLDVDDIRTAVCDQDRTPASRAIVRALTADGTLALVPDVPDSDRPGALLEEGRAQAVLVLPRGLSADLLAGRPVEVQVLVDGTDPLRAQVAGSAPVQYLFREGMRRALERQAAAGALRGRAITIPTIQVEPRILYNPQMESTLFMVPGLPAIILLVITTVVTAMGIAREREIGTIEQILITPIRPSVLLLGKIIPYALIGVVTTGLVLAVGTHLFAIPVRGSLLALLLGTVLYLMSTLGAGVFISTIARTQQQAILGGLFFILPAILLSGFATPVESMPDWIEPLTWINPVRYFVTILRAILLKGAGVADLWEPLLALLGFGTLILAAASLRFRRTLA